MSVSLSFSDNFPGWHFVSLACYVHYDIWYCVSFPVSEYTCARTHYYWSDSIITITAAMRVTFRCFQQAFTQVSSSLDFVPQAKPASLADVTRLQQFVSDANRVLVLTGAGLSTESGIPDYRSEGVGLYARTSRRPMQYQEFVRNHSGRQRYWARNFVGWPKFSSFQPNIAHQTLQDWQQKGKVRHIVTQNVDSLHTKAGCADVIELHGCSHRVVGTGFVKLKLV